MKTLPPFACRCEREQRRERWAFLRQLEELRVQFEVESGGPALLSVCAERSRLQWRICTERAIALPLGKNNTEWDAA